MGPFPRKDNGCETLCGLVGRLSLLSNVPSSRVCDELLLCVLNNSDWLASETGELETTWVLSTFCCVSRLGLTAVVSIVIVGLSNIVNR